MNAMRILAVAVAVAVVVLAAGGAHAATRTFNGDVDNTWNEPDNWEDEGGQSGVPDSTDTAIIPFNKIVTTNAQDAECKILELVASAELKISEGSTFTLHGGSTPGNDSTIDGFITFVEHDDSNVTPVLKIMETTTIVGGTGIISTGSGTRGIIRGNTSSTTLTIDKEGIGSGLLLAGDLDIEIKLVNNSQVITFSGTLNLKTNEKSGNGLWESNLTGILNVDVELKGNGLLLLTGTGEININADCPNFAGLIQTDGGTFTVSNEIATSHKFHVAGGSVVIDAAVSMTGRVVVTGGTLIVNENLCTTGDIHYANGGTITVAGGATPKSASFGGSCP